MKKIIDSLNSRGLDNEVINELYEYFNKHLDETLIRYWAKFVDKDYGGVFTCISNDGNTILSKNKYIWSQGRFLWMWSRQVDFVRRKISSHTLDELEQQCHNTFYFLLNHALSKDGRVYYLLDDVGKPIESQEGRGYHNSIFADCFLISGLTEYSRVFKNKRALNLALVLYKSVWNKISSGEEVPSDPYPAPKAFKPYSYNMLMIYLTQELYDLLKNIKHEYASQLYKNLDEVLKVHFILHHDKNDKYKTIEMAPKSTDELDTLKDTLLYKHFTPGHTLEAMWFCKHAADTLGQDYSNEIISSAMFALNKGWDGKFGGLFRIVDTSTGNKPEGRLIGEMYEDLIQTTWDKKIWWTHAEALYTTLLIALEYKSKEVEKWFITHFEYTMQLFPDKNGNEWLQIRERDGTPIDQVVALPVKDPYHIARCVQFIVELLIRYK